MDVFDSADADPTRCPLCGRSEDLDPLKGADKRTYLLCGNCWLVFVPKEEHLDPVQEKARYETHQNSIENAGYCNFLRRLLNPMLQFVEPGMRGLDYGCGPGPTLALLAETEGLECDNYDPFFFSKPYEDQYDFVLATEVIEHFRSPREDIGRMVASIRPNGFWGVMTELWECEDQFADWYYTRDPTHICFYHRKTFEFISDLFGFDPLWSDGKRVFILKKNLR